MEIGGLRSYAGGLFLTLIQAFSQRKRRGRKKERENSMVGEDVGIRVSICTTHPPSQPHTATTAISQYTDGKRLGHFSATGLIGGERRRRRRMGGRNGNKESSFGHAREEGKRKEGGSGHKKLFRVSLSPPPVLTQLPLDFLSVCMGGRTLHFRTLPRTVVVRRCANLVSY